MRELFETLAEGREISALLEDLSDSPHCHFADYKSKANKILIGETISDLLCNVPRLGTDITPAQRLGHARCKREELELLLSASSLTSVLMLVYSWLMLTTRALIVAFGSA